MAMSSLASRTALILLVAGILSSCEGEEEGEEPAPASDPGPAVAVPAAGAWLVEIEAVASDALPFEGRSRPGWTAADEVEIRPGPLVVLGPAAIAALANPGADGAIEVEAGIAAPGDVRAVVVERIRFEGAGRRGGRRRGGLARGRAAVPARRGPEAIALGPFDDWTALWELLPWPSDVEWKIVDDGRLEVVAGGRRSVLDPGGERELEPVAIEIPVRLGGFAPTAKGDPAAAEPRVVEEDLGRIRFESRVLVRFHGRARIEAVR